MRWGRCCVNGGCLIDRPCRACYVAVTTTTAAGGGASCIRCRIIGAGNGPAGGRPAWRPCSCSSSTRRTASSSRWVGAPGGTLRSPDAVAVQVCVVEAGIPTLTTCCVDCLHVQAWTTCWAACQLAAAVQLQCQQQQRWAAQQRRRIPSTC
jgi:hypothetical protein